MKSDIFRIKALPFTLKRRINAAGVHFGLSLLLAAIAGVLVFAVWYPHPYWEISGGPKLFLLMTTVDVIMGPLMTFVVFNVAKRRVELFRDLTIIGFIQAAALAYGLWIVAVVRPVHLVFEIDRFRVVHAIEVPAELLDQALPDLQRLPLSGPTLLSIREFKDSNESFESIMAELRGSAISFRPGMWQSYAKAKPQVVHRAKPLSELKKRFPARTDEINSALASWWVTTEEKHGTSVGYIPMVGRVGFWTVFIDTKTADIISFVPIDSF